MLSPVIGLEVHLQVKTNSKMFCRCNSNYFGAEPNTNVCPVCFGLPGALPVPNKKAFECAVKLALALNCKVNRETKFDRKNYFYPDLPKGYQISQFDEPIGEEGFVEIEKDGDSLQLRIQRVHLEEDTAKSIHSENDETLIDFNKSGVALIEIVTKPDFTSTTEVILFAKRLRQIVRYLGVSDAEMQKGQMRFELNISVRSKDLKQGELPPYKVEVKNIGSISVLEKVTNFEIKRQSELLEKGEILKNETRGLKGMTGETLHQRTKESSDDYRYFPEPDIAPIHISDELINSLTESQPELPSARKQRYLLLGLENDQADVFVEDQSKGDWFDGAIKIIESREKIAEVNLYKELAKWIIGDISAHLEKRSMQISEMPFNAEWLIQLILLVLNKSITGTIAKKLIEEEFSNLDSNSLYKTEKSAQSLVEEKGYMQTSDESFINQIVKEVLEENQKVIADLAKNPNAIKFLVGQVMKLSKGKINPRVAEEALKQKI